MSAGNRLLVCTVAALAAIGLAQTPAAHAQVVGSYDNFDCFNDTGQEAEGFEIDVEDVVESDLTREFPSNFSTTPWVIRYGLPKVTAYDWTIATADPEHAYDQGHKGVLITWAATWDGTQWIAPQGSNPAAPGVAGNGTPFNPNPTLTAGDSCWWWGLGSQYPSSGCDHFGISFGAGVTPGRISYHWKVPSPSLSGVLVNGPLEASIPPSPYQAPLANQPRVIEAVAQAPENPEPQWGDAYWVKVTTFFGKQAAELDALQKVNVKKVRTKTVSWHLLQKPPEGEVGEKDDVEDDAVPANAVQVTKQYEYFQFGNAKNATPTVAYDSETHEALCEIYRTQADAAAGTNPLPVDCDKPYQRTYWVQDPLHGAVLVKGGNLGPYIGAHINAYNLQ